MKVFYSKSENRPDVSCETPIDVSLETALEIFKDLIPKRGFMGIELDERFVLQIGIRKRGPEVELLDTSIPAFDSSTVDSQFAESLIRAAAAGRDVFQIARSSNYVWEHWNLAQPTATSKPNLDQKSPSPSRNDGPIEFTATEMGFKNGLGGASNSKAPAPYHYILFGKQVDPEHACNSGIYFECDSQRNGAVNQVVKVVLAQAEAHFSIRDGQTILVRRSQDDDSWQKFKQGVHEVFERLIEPKT